MQSRSQAPKGFTALPDNWQNMEPKPEEELTSAHYVKCPWPNCGTDFCTYRAALRHFENAHGMHTIGAELHEHYQAALLAFIG